MKVSLILVAYRHERFVRDAVRSILSQDCPPVEILICDDASDDATFDIIDEEVSAYTGPHEVTAWKNESNRGEGNFWSVARRASGDVLVMFHGDDISRPDRVSRLTETMKDTGAALVSSNATIIDGNGREIGPLLLDEPSAWIPPETAIRTWDRRRLGATQAFRRELVDDFLEWRPDRIWAAGDHILPFRALILGGCYFLGESLVCWRQHETNMTKEVSRVHHATPEDNEITLAADLSSRSFMLEDLEHYIARNPSQAARLKDIHALTREAALDHLRSWSHHRNTLLNGGRRPSWIARAEAMASEAFKIAHMEPDARARPLAVRGLRRIGRALERIGRWLSRI